jgi:hypothetical protein
VKKQRGTLITGRFQPDPFFLVSIVAVTWLAGLALAASLTTNERGLVWLRAYWLGTTAGAAQLGIGLSLTGAGLLRSWGWQRQCLAVVAVIERVCQTSRPLERGSIVAGEAARKDYLDPPFGPSA